MKQSDKRHVQELIHTLVELGLRHVVLSPGSRNAPISYSFTYHPKVTTYAVTDERSAGFIALGMAQTLNEPVAVVCTSGSAAINYGPAAAEAYYQHIPLLILTADRPKELIDQGIGQAIHQQNMFANYIKGSFEIADSEELNFSPWNVRRQVNTAWNLCLTAHHGPVHINIPLREPLYGMVESSITPVPVERIVQSECQLSKTQEDELREALEHTEKVLVVIGQTQGEQWTESLIPWVQKPNVMVLTETTSNVHSAGVFACIDRLIMSMSGALEEAFIPDILITAGHNLISRKIKALLQGKVKTHWHVDIADIGLDTFQCLTSTIAVMPAHFFNKLGSFQAPATAQYRSQFSNLHHQNLAAHTPYLATCAFSDLKAFAQILPTLPESSLVQMGNSSVVRYIQLFDPREDLLYFGNRGVSGIDGCTSTAVGAAYHSPKPVTLITGDLAFFYDVNGLWNNLLPDNLKIIVINNGGGGIFRIIDGPSQSGVLEEVFELPHNRNAQFVCADFGIPYFTAKDESSLHDALRQFWSNDGIALLEIFTPREENDRVLKDYFGHLRRNVNDSDLI